MAFALDSASFFLSASCLVSLSRLSPLHKTVSRTSGAVQDLGEGLGTAFRSSWLWITILIFAWQRHGKRPHQCCASLPGKKDAAHGCGDACRSLRLRRDWICPGGGLAWTPVKTTSPWTARLLRVSHIRHFRLRPGAADICDWRHRTFQLIDKRGGSQ